MLQKNKSKLVNKCNATDNMHKHTVRDNKCTQSDTANCLHGTCSLVVLPRQTRTTWKHIRPITGNDATPATTITQILMTNS